MPWKCHTYKPIDLLLYTMYECIQYITIMCIIHIIVRIGTPLSALLRNSNDNKFQYECPENLPIV